MISIKFDNNKKKKKLQKIIFNLTEVIDSLQTMLSLNALPHKGLPYMLERAGLDVQQG